MTTPQPASPREIPALFRGLERIGPYRIVDTLGAGGTAVVFRAVHRISGRPVALKLLRPEIAERVPLSSRRFKREIALVEVIDHPNVVQLYEHGQSNNGVLWMALEEIQGLELLQILRQDAPLSLKRARAIILDILAGLDAAHQQRIVHRDLKPSNVMLTTLPDGSERARIVDFGLAKVFGPDAWAAQHAIPGPSDPGFGTPRHMAAGPLPYRQGCG